MVPKRTLAFPFPPSRQTTILAPKRSVSLPSFDLEEGIEDLVPAQRGYLRQTPKKPFAILKLPYHFAHGRI
jgi:hypothetical protein